MFVSKISEAVKLSQLIIFQVKYFTVQEFSFLEHELQQSHLKLNILR